jgi:GNAT superfamily N-acetyltransferase
VKWRQFGERCAIKVEFIIPEIPMNEWAMAISKKCEDEDQEQNEKSGHSEAFDEPADDESDEPGDEKNTTAPVATDENSEPEKPDSLPESPIKRLGSQDFQEALVQFLDPWVEMLFPGNRPWILDPRVPVGGPVGLTFIEEIEIERFLRGEDIVKRFRDELGAPERKGSIHTVARYESLARRSWPNWEGFRPKTQAPAIQTIIESSEDVFVGIPTGEGKSVLFQIPALEEGMGSGKLTIVISPLRALMKDQVVSLHKKGYVFSADYLSSDLDRWGLAEAHQRIIDGTTTLLYVAPERFRNARFLDAIRRRYDFDEGFGYIVLDEAHCFWLWGNEFRPDYFNAVGYLRKEFRDQGAAFRFLLFSATVTESVLAHVRTKLGHGLDGLGLEVSPKDRLHPVRDFLSLVPKPFPGASGGNYRDRLEARVGKMAKLIEDEKINPKNSLVLVFVPMKRQAEECAEILGTKLVSRKNFICRLENF